MNKMYMKAKGITFEYKGSHEQCKDILYTLEELKNE